MKIIIVGAGEVGYHFAEWLAQEKKEVVVIDTGMPVFAKWILCLDMLLGRLEIYTVIILLVPKFYKK